MSDTTQDLMSVLSQFSPRPEDGPREMVQAGEGEEFWLHDGPALRNIHDLKHALDNITDEQFAFHVGEGKNDFANWVRYVLKDDECAAALLRCKTILSTRRVLIKHLKHYS